MSIGDQGKLQAARRELQDARAELKVLEKEIQAFEAQVDARLGTLLDQLSDLNAETTQLDEQVRKIREKRLFGSDLMNYTEGAPKPAPPINLMDLPPMGLVDRKVIHATAGEMPSGPAIPDMKTLYRKLARRYHPDLARNNADRALSNRQMAEINQAYTSGDLPALMRLAGMNIPYGVDVSQSVLQAEISQKRNLSEGERVELELREVRQRINRLSNLPVVRLSLEVKLAGHQGRNLLHELATELRYKVARKTAERDYLRAQIQVSGEINPEG